MNKYLKDAEAAMSGLENTPTEAFGEIGPELTLQLVIAKATIAAAQEVHEANKLARQAAQRQHIANLISYAGLFKLLKSSIPTHLKNKIDQAMLGDDQDSARISNL